MKSIDRVRKKQHSPKPASNNTETPFVVIKEFFGYTDLPTGRGEMEKLQQALLVLDHTTLEPRQLVYLVRVLQQMAIMSEALQLLKTAWGNPDRAVKKKRK